MIKKLIVSSIGLFLAFYYIFSPNQYERVADKTYQIVANGTIEEDYTGIIAGSAAGGAPLLYLLIRGVSKLFSLLLKGIKKLNCKLKEKWKKFPFQKWKQWICSVAIILRKWIRKALSFFHKCFVIILFVCILTKRIICFLIETVHNFFKQIKALAKKFF